MCQAFPPLLQACPPCSAGAPWGTPAIPQQAPGEEHVSMTTPSLQGSSKGSTRAPPRAQPKCSTGFTCPLCPTTPPHATEVGTRGHPAVHPTSLVAPLWKYIVCCVSMETSIAHMPAGPGSSQPWEMPPSISVGFSTSLPGSGIIPCGISWPVVAGRGSGAGRNPSARYCRGSWGHTACPQHALLPADCGGRWHMKMSSSWPGVTQEIIPGRGMRSTHKDFPYCSLLPLGLKFLANNHSPAILAQPFSSLSTS